MRAVGGSTSGGTIERGRGQTLIKEAIEEVPSHRMRTNWGLGLRGPHGCSPFTDRAEAPGGTTALTSPARRGNLDRPPASGRACSPSVRTPPPPEIVARPHLRADRAGPPR